MIKAVLFDMNGIIIDDEHIHEMAFRETVKPYNIDLDHQAYLDCCAGKTDRAGYEQIAEKFPATLPIDDLLRQKSQMYLQLFPANKKDYPGVIDLIHSLAKDFTLALTSSSSRDEVDLITKEFGINQEFKLTISANEVTKGKPDPEPYRITAQKLGFKPEECVVIEDSKSGVISAKAAGCYCIGVTTTHSKEDLKRADIIVDAFSNMTVEVIRNLSN
ncbi:MAG: HAD family phosphatase [bacterium]|nr:HAD family phosphatase [bacterium]